MNINQLLAFSFLIYILLNRSTIESFGNQKEICIQRVLDFECMDPEKKESINNECSEYNINISTGVTNINCDNKVLFDTLLCNKMISEGACDGIYGRTQIERLCNVDPIYISCPTQIPTRDLTIIKKIKSLNEEKKECVQKTLTCGYQDKGGGNNLKYIGIGVVLFLVFIMIILFIKK